MKKTCVLLIFSFYGLSANPAQAASTGVTSDAAAACAGLLTHTEIDQRSSVSLSYAYNRLRSSTDHRTGASEGGVSIPGIGKITGANNYNHESKRLEDLGVKWELDESASYIARFVPANQSSDYLACVTRVTLASDAGVGIELNDVVGTTASFNAKIRPTGGIDIKRKLVIWTNGIPKDKWAQEFKTSDFNVKINVEWPDPGKPLVVRAQMAQASGDRRGSMIGRAARYIIWPEIKETPFIGKSGYAEARYPNRFPPGRYLSSSPITVTAAADEVLIPSSAREIEGTWLPPTWGAKKNWKCDREGLVWDAKNDAQLISADVYCDGGYSDENPGHKSRFQVAGVKFSVAQPNPSIKMEEKMFEDAPGR